MPWTKQDLRECGRLAIEETADPPPQIDEVRGPGIVPGARLRVADGSNERIVAIRTSWDRNVGFARRPDGRWVTMPNVDEVLVVAPSAEEPDLAEIFSFDSYALTEAFDAALAVRKAESPDLSRTAPIFVALDGEPDVTTGLLTKAKSRVTIQRSELLMRRRANRATEESFIDRVKREFAEINGVDVSNVVLEIKIVA